MPIPAWVGPAVSIGGNILGGLFDDSADEMSDAIEAATNARSTGVRNATGTLADYYRQALALSEPGLEAYGASMDVLTPLLTRGYVPTAAASRYDAGIAKNKAQVADVKRRLGEAKRELARTTSAQGRANLQAAITRMEGSLKGVTGRLKTNQAKAKAVPNKKMTVNEWMQSVDPGYGFRFAEGQKAVTGRQSSRGDRLSGRALKELTRYGQDYASNEFGRSVNRLMDLARFGDVATGRASGLTSGQGSTLAGLEAANYGQVADSLTQRGGVAAADSQRWADILSGAGGDIAYEIARRRYGASPLTMGGV